MGFPFFVAGTQREPSPTAILQAFCPTGIRVRIRMVGSTTVTKLSLAPRPPLVMIQRAPLSNSMAPVLRLSGSGPGPRYPEKMTGFRVARSTFHSCCTSFSAAPLPVTA